MTHPHSSPFHGIIEVICGSMFSGKTEELLRRIKRAHIARQKTQVFKPHLDDRYSTSHIQSHNANQTPSESVGSAWEILDRMNDHTRLVGIDEAQFFDESIVEVAQKLAYRGIHVVVAGLDMDYLGKPFGPMPQLLAIAEAVTKLQAVCVICGGPASRTQRTSAPDHASGSTILVGAQEFYEARCRFCHDPQWTPLPSWSEGLSRSAEPRERSESSDSPTPSLTGGASG
ncbi:MAG: thymidine kinase [Bdellovibrionia bacterium]